ncbi:MAG: urease accessory protein UreD [Cellvibrionaceae bacterium]
MTMSDQNTAALSTGFWEADLELELSYNDRGSRLTRNRHSGPLYVQKPFYPEGKDCAHIYLLHPPGGLVSGDTLETYICVKDNARGLVTTPGAAKMYKARPDEAVQRQNTVLKINNNASLEWFPMEAIVYPGALAELRTTIELAENSHFIGWEITCFGLPASQDAFKQGRFKQQYRIEKNGVPIFIDNLNLIADNEHDESPLFSGRAGMQSQAISGFFVAGPFNFSQSEKDDLLEILRHKITAENQEKTIAATYVNNLIVIRYLGKSAYTARQNFTLLWESIRPLLIGRKACSPRIWLT